MAEAVLALNAGSSSLKFAVFRAVGGPWPEPRLRGQVEGLGVAPHLVARDGEGLPLAERRWPDGAHLTHEDFLGAVLDLAGEHLDGDRLVAVGHRIVHGGLDFSGPVRVDTAVQARLAALSPLAPLHQPHNLSALTAAAAMRPDLPQVACFDTGFHRTQPAVATRFALPRRYEAMGVRRYGFHGISYDYLARRLAELDPALASGKVIGAHLGNGASLCAMQAGVSLDTTMGFTAVDGLVMGTRCGALDPGVLLHLLRSESLSADAIEALIYRQSGLLGVSGLSSDMRALLASEAPEAREAVELFVYRLGREAGALASTLGGLDGLVFTAGIGEHAPPIRAAVAARLAWLGAELDEAANAAGAMVVSTRNSRVKLMVLPADEERMIAAYALALLDRGATT